MSEGARILATVCGRATCWSVTINNPLESEYTLTLPAGWKLEGQIEKGAEGTTHFQGMLTTTQQRFSAIKQIFPRAHIEIARDKLALSKYVHKSDTRIQEVKPSVGLTVFKLQDQVAGRWDSAKFEEFQRAMKYPDDAHLRYADIIVRELISDGAASGIEFVAINPMWRTSWKLFGRNIIQRYNIRNGPVHVCDSETTGGTGGSESGSVSGDSQEAAEDCV